MLTCLPLLSMYVLLSVCYSWDIRDTPLGDALYECHVLDYDLVRQVSSLLTLLLYI